MKPAFFGLQKHSFSNNPILVIDRDGLIGEPLSLKLSKEFLVVFVSKRNLDLDVENQNIAHVPFFKKFPAIPDNKYSHIIFIDEERRDLELLPKIIDKVKNVNADLIFAQGMFAKREYEIGKILRMCPNAKVALFGDIFENRLILKKENFRSVINKYIHQAQKFGKILVSGDGLREVYPVFLQDVVDGLIDLVFKIHESDSLFYIFPKHPPFALSLAHMIQKSNPEIMIDFTRNDPKIEEISYPPNGKNLLGDKYPLAKRIRSIDIRKKVRVHNESRESVKKLKKAHIFIIWVLIFLLFFPFVFTTLFSSLGLNAFYYAKGEATRGSFSSTKSAIHLSQTFFYLGKQTLKIFSFQARIIRQENNLKKLAEDIDLGYTLSEALSQGFNSETYFSKILSGESKNPIEDFIKGENCLKSSIIALDKIKAEGKIPAPILQNLEIINPIIRFLSSIVDIMPNILGMEGPKTYLILFQDNLELRPGGGLIDSYGILKLNMGKITEFSLHNTSDADKQLKGHVEPPFAIRRYLPEQHWYMKDSNFDVDFIKSASSAANFFFVEAGQKADGVIAVDTSFIKSILHVVGSVYVADYKEVVDENNLYALMQSNAEKKFSPDSAQKKDFLKSLNKAIMEKIVEKKASYFLIAKSISEALTQKHLMFVLNNDSRNILIVNGWSSSLWDERKNSRGTVNDFVGINEANLGNNKVGYFIRRLMSQKITIGNDGNITEELVINYKNDSTAWSGGDYKNYLRVILPKNVKLSEILINNQVQDIIDAVTNPLTYEAKNFKVSQGLEVEEVSEGNKTIFGFLVRVPIGKIIKVKLKYALSENTSELNVFSYNLKLFKQPGVDNLPYSLSFVYPNSFNVIKSSDEIVRKKNETVFSEKIITDKNLLINFAKK